MFDWLSQATSLGRSFFEITAVIFAILIVFSMVFIPLSAKKKSKALREIVLRIYSWWAIIILITFTFVGPMWLATIVVSLLAFIAMREYLSNIIKNDDYRKTLLYVYLTIPIQFYLAKHGSLYSFNFFIPVFMFFLIPIRNIFSGNYKNYIEFNGKAFNYP